MAQKLPSNWSWKEIQTIYRIYNQQMNDMRDLAKRLQIHLPLERELRYLSDMHPQRAEIVCRLFFDARRLAAQVSVLDREIERRNGLVGVM